MVKLLIKLAVVALIANASYRIGSEYLTYIKFRDDVRDAATFKTQNDDELSALILQLGEKYDLPVDPAAIRIARTQRQVSINGSYEKPIEVVPSYFYPWTFSWSIEANVSPVVPPYRPRSK